MENPAKVPEWNELLEISRDKTTVKWKTNVNQSPATVALSSHLSKMTEGEKPPVVLYRDTNAWCPFCERVWFALEEKEIPFDVELIDLSNKPKWYMDMVPTGLVPAVKIEGELICESKSILLELENRFPENPLLPEESEKKAIALNLIESCDQGELSTTGFKFIKSISSEQNQTPQELEELKNNLETKLHELEKALEKYTGDFFLSSFGLVDIMYTPMLQRFSSNLPVFGGYKLRGNDKYPLLNRWLKAINNRRAYQIVKPDDHTNHLFGKKIFQLRSIHDNLEQISNYEADYNLSNSEEDRGEAAVKLSDNNKIVTQDILKNAGIKAWINEESLAKVQEYVDVSLRILADYLIKNGSIRLEEYEMMNNREMTVICAISLSYIRNRVCVPRDLSAGAANEFKKAIDNIVRSLYSYSI